MKRRQLLAGISACYAGGAGILGTGAVSSVTADRAVSVTVAPDFETANSSGAYLQLSDTSDIAIPNISKGTLTLDYTRLNEVAIGDGFNPNSVYEIVRGPDGIFGIQNQTDSPVEIAAVTADSPSAVPNRDDASELPYDPEQISDDGPRIELFDVEDSGRSSITDENRYELSTGEHLYVGTRVIVPDIPPGDYNQVLLLHAREGE